MRHSRVVHVSTWKPTYLRMMTLRNHNYEIENCMPLTDAIATNLAKIIIDVRKTGFLWWLQPDGNTNVTIEYLQSVDGLRWVR